MAHIHQQKKPKMGDHTNSAITSSLLDTREYKFVTLENGIEAVLVRAPDCQSSKAAVSVVVNAGSMSEPAEFGGLAHFVEHCVFLGNEKYNTRNSLDKHLSKHNGYSNAHTELEYTAFYLEVNREGLTKAVDIFAAAFEAPLFDQDMCCGELEAVDSEFSEVLNNDECRVEAMFCHLSDPSHLYRKFTWGNKGSLLQHGREKLVSSAKAFFDAKYSPKGMKVSIVSSYSFDKMETLLKKFESIPPRSSSLLPSPLMGCAMPVNPSSLPMTLRIQPVAEIHQLVLLFQLPPLFRHYRTKPVDFIAHLIGHEAEGSLFLRLKEANLAESVSAGVGSDGYACNSGLCMFEIKLGLTKLGVANWQSIVHQYVLPYIAQLAESGIQESTYNELRSINQFLFNNTLEHCTREPIDTAEELAVALLDFYGTDRRDILVQDYMYSEFNEELIRDYLSYLRADACITLLVSGDAGNEWTETEPIFGIKYSVIDTTCPITAVANTGLFIIPPPPNVFAPSNEAVDRLEVLAKKTKEITTAPSFELSPVPGVKMYVFQTLRSQPSLKADIRVRFKLAPTYTDRASVITQFIHTQLWVSYVTDQLEASLYPAKLTGFTVGIAAVAPNQVSRNVGVEVSINGCYEKIYKVLELVVDALTRVASGAEPIDTIRLSRIVEAMDREFKNEEIHPVSTQALNIRKSVLAPFSFYRAHERLSALTAIGKDASPANFFLAESIDCLLSGSVSPTLIEQVTAILLSVGVHPADAGNTSSDLSTQFKVSPISAENQLVEVTMNPTEPTSCIAMYYQLSPVFSVATSVAGDVITDLMSQPFFDSLRTEEQLGYSVECGARHTNGSVGIEFIIQSSKESPEQMVKRIERFISNFFEKEVQTMTDEEYSDQLDALIDGLTEAPTSLAREAKEIWAEIVEQRFCWDLHKQVKREVKNTFVGKSKNVVMDLIQSCLIDGKSKRVVVKVNGIHHRD